MWDQLKVTCWFKFYDRSIKNILDENRNLFNPNPAANDTAIEDLLSK